MYKHVVCILAALVAAGSCEGVERIIGGKEVEISSYPYVVSLQMLMNSTYIHVCGASIISDSWLVTAAHCLGLLDPNTGDTHTYKPGAMKAVVGSSRIARDAADRQLRNCSKLLMNPAFDFKRPGNDIGLIKLSEKVGFSERVASIKMVKEKQPAVDPEPRGQCLLLGWGTTAVPTDQSQVLSLVSPNLKMLEISLTSVATCNEAYEGKIVPYKQFCGVAKASNGTSCLGDSGGPVVCDGELWGVISGGKECGVTGMPDVFTRLDDNAPWIQDVLARDQIWRKHKSASSASWICVDITTLLIVLNVSGV